MNARYHTQDSTSIEALSTTDYVVGTIAVCKRDPNDAVYVEGVSSVFTSPNDTSVCGILLEVGEEYLLDLSREYDVIWTMGSCGLTRRSPTKTWHSLKTRLFVTMIRVPKNLAASLRCAQIIRHSWGNRTWRISTLFDKEEAFRSIVTELRAANNRSSSEYGYEAMRPGYDLVVELVHATLDTRV